MENKVNKKSFGLLPNYFKKIGLVLISLILIALFLNKRYTFFEKSELQKKIFMSFFLIGLYFIAWAKDKFEDEMMVQNRLKALTFSVSWMLFYFLITIIIAKEIMEASQLLLSFFIVFIIYHHSMKFKL